MAGGWGPNSNPNPEPNPEPKPNPDTNLNPNPNSIGFKSNLGKFTAPRPQSSQARLLESADDWKVQFDVNDEGVSFKERPFSSEIAVVSGPGSRPDVVIWSMQMKTVI